MHKFRSAVLCLCIVASAWAASGRPYPSFEQLKVTWADAPPIAQKLKFTLNEARSLFTADELAHLSIDEKRPMEICGRWRVTRPEYRNGKAIGGNEVDKEFREGGNTPKSNPAALTVDSGYIYAPPLPPDQTHLGKYVRISVRAIANSAHAEGKRIEYLRKLRAEGLAKKAAKPDTLYNYFHEPDLKFGIRRNEAHGDLRKDGSGARVTVELASERHFASVHIYVTMEGAAVPMKRVVLIAKGAAAIMSNKIWGTQVKVAGAEREPAGISDAWFTTKLGATPEEDRRENKVTFARTMYVAVAHYAPINGKPVRINIWWKPGQDAVAASRERAPTANVNSDLKKPLDPTDENGIPEAISYGADGKLKHQKDVVVKTLPNGIVVAYIPIYTDDYNEFLRGPGSWNVRIEMEQVLEDNPEGDDKVLELSTGKATMTVVDNPAISGKIYTLPKGD